MGMSRKGGYVSSDWVLKLSTFTVTVLIEKLYYYGFSIFSVVILNRSDLAG